MTNYCSVCNRYLRDRDALKVHLSNNAHRHRQEEYDNDPMSIVGPYSQRLAEDICSLAAKVCTNQTNWKCNIKNLYDLYAKEGRRGGIVYLEATRWKTLSELGNWIHDQGSAIFDESEGSLQIPGQQHTIKMSRPLLAAQSTTIIASAPRSDKTPSVVDKPTAPVVKPQILKTRPKAHLGENPLFKKGQE